MQIGNENGESKKLFQMKKDLLPKRGEFWMKLREEYNLRTWKIDSMGKVEKEEKDEL